MKSLHSLFVTATLLLCAAAVQAQIALRDGNPEDFASVKSQPLLVVLKDEDPKEVKMLADRSKELAAYREYIAQYNARLQELAPRVWKFSPSVEFIHAADLPALRKAKGKQHGVWREAELVDVRNHATFSASTADVVNHLTTFTLELYGDGIPRRVMFVSIAPGSIQASDIVFGLGNMQAYMQERLDGRSSKDVRTGVAESSRLLATKTLLLDQARLTDGLTAANIREVYPFPYEVVPRSTIEQAVASADARYAYIRVWPLTEDVLTQLIVDTATSRVLGYHTGSGGVTRGNLKDFAKAARK